MRILCDAYHKEFEFISVQSWTYLEINEKYNNVLRADFKDERDVVFLIESGRLLASHDWFRFYFSLVEKVARDF